MRTSSYYESLFDSAAILPEWQASASTWARKIRSGEARYKIVEAATGVPWPVVGAIAMRESGCDWTKNLHNGQPWNRKTTLVPVGRGPFGSWESAAVDALGRGHALQTIGDIGAFLEKFNGGGYMKRGVHSPYLWSGTQHGLGVGKYVADGKYDPRAVDKQLGAMTVLKLDLWRTNMLLATDDSPRWAFGRRGDWIIALQIALRDSGVDPGPIDGICGRRTADAFRQATGRHLAGDPEGAAIAYRDRIAQAAKLLSDQVAQLGASVGDLRELV